MCGAEALLIAVRLAATLVRPEYPAYFSDRATLINPVCGCGCVYTESAKYACMAAEAEAKEKRLAAFNARVKEFRDIARMCGIEVKP